jgi:hypothetical protein
LLLVYGVLSAGAWLLILLPRGGPVSLLTITLAALGPVWIAWLKLLPRRPGDAPARRRIALTAGFVATAVVLLALVLASAFLAQRGFALAPGFDFTGEASGRGRGRMWDLFLWLLPTMLVLFSGWGAYYGISELWQMTRRVGKA